MEKLEIRQIDAAELEMKVKKMYSDVALDPFGEYHFEMGRPLAEKLGYEKDDLDKVPAPSIESFAGVGYFFDLAEIKEGEWVLDLGSGSGMDSFIASLKVGKTGKVVGVDMTDEQLDKAERLRKEHDFGNVEFVKSHIENLPFQDGNFDVAISNGVINLCSDKAKAFAEISRVLRPGGRMVIADIVTEKQLPENVVCNTTLWASCIGGASQRNTYQDIIEDAGLMLLAIKMNTDYTFLSKSAKRSSEQYGVNSISLLAEKKD
jgi:arsenite methyltransferase